MNTCVSLTAMPLGAPLWYAYLTAVLYSIGHSAGNPTYGSVIGDIFSGRKIGLTSRAMQRSSQITEPDYAPLMDDMFFEQGTDIEAGMNSRREGEARLIEGVCQPQASSAYLAILDSLRGTKNVAFKTA